MISRGYAGLFGGSSSAALANGEDRLKPAHRVTVKVDVELATLAGGHAVAVTVADAGLGSLAGVDVVVGHVVFFDYYRTSSNPLISLSISASGAIGSRLPRQIGQPAENHRTTEHAPSHRRGPRPDRARRLGLDLGRPHRDRRASRGRQVWLGG